MATSDDGNTDDVKLNIYQRINAVMGEADAITPDGAVMIGGKKAYEYISHDAVTAKLKPLFVKYGIVPVPTIFDRLDNGNRIELLVDVDFVNMDDSTDRITVRSLGYGCDNQDKGPGKALSYAVKNAYLKVCMLNSADDSGGELTPHAPADDRVPAEDKRKAYEAAAKTYKAALEGAETIKDLRDLKKSNDEWLAEAPETTRDYFADLFKKRTTDIEALETL